MTVPADIAAARPMTFGERAVRLPVNPGADPAVVRLSSLYAQIIDLLQQRREATRDGETSRLYALAITKAQEAHLEAARAVTWE